jgi:3-hydroxybutyryl-CoA dehydratase
MKAARHLVGLLPHATARAPRRPLPADDTAPVRAVLGRPACIGARPCPVADLAEGLRIEATASFTKTVGEADVTLFAGLTGDFHSVPTDEARMRRTTYGRRLVHGVFVLGLMSAAGAKLTADLPVSTVSIGYDGVRFVRPVFIGDTLTATYGTASHQPERSRVLSEVASVNQTGEAVASATRLLKVVS